MLGPCFHTVVNLHGHVRLLPFLRVVKPHRAPAATYVPPTTSGCPSGHLYASAGGGLAGDIGPGISLGTVCTQEIQTQ